MTAFRPGWLRAGHVTAARHVAARFGRGLAQGRARFAPAVSGGGVIRCAALVLAMLCAVPPADAAKPTERSRQKAAAEAERAQLQQKLSALKQDISRTEAAKEDAADTLAASEAAISDANRTLRDLMQEQRQTELKLKQLAAEQKRLSEIVAQQQTQLSKLLRQHYVAGKEDRVKLLLSGDNPNRIERDLQYMGYLSQAQAAMLATLRANLAAVEQNQEQTQNTQDELAEIAQEQQQQKVTLEQEKAKRAAVLAQVSNKLQAQRQEAGNLERDEQRMTALVGKLAKLIEEQAAEQRRIAAEQKRLAAERAAKLAQAKAQTEAQAQAEARAKAGKHGRSSAGTIASAGHGAGASASARVGENGSIDSNAQTLAANAADKATTQSASSDSDLKNEQVPGGAQEGNFAALRGKLHLPLRGAINRKFGSKRADGPASKGLFIRAAEGAEVKAVANGRVLFAEWLRGFGNLMIVDHGGQYMTIYGNNQSLLKRAGDQVKNGDTIAYAGNSGGNEESGLYFEMRHQGRAFDPLAWVTIK